MTADQIYQVLIAVLSIISLLAMNANRREQNKGKERDAKLKEYEVDIAQIKSSQSTIDRVLLALGKSEENRALDQNNFNESYRQQAAAMRESLVVQQQVVDKIHVMAEQTKASVGQFTEFQTSFFARREVLEAGIIRIEEVQKGAKATSDETLSKVDLLNAGLEDIKKTLDGVILATNGRLCKEDIADVERDIAELLNFARAQAQQKPQNLDDTLPLVEPDTKDLPRLEMDEEGVLVPIIPIVTEDRPQQ